MDDFAETPLWRSPLQALGWRDNSGNTEEGVFKEEPGTQIPPPWPSPVTLADIGEGSQISHLVQGQARI